MADGFPVLCFCLTLQYTPLVNPVSNTHNKRILTASRAIPTPTTHEPVICTNLAIKMLPSPGLRSIKRTIMRASGKAVLGFAVTSTSACLSTALERMYWIASVIDIGIALEAEEEGKGEGGLRIS